MNNYEDEKTAVIFTAVFSTKIYTTIYMLPTGNLDSRSGGEVMELLQNVWKKTGRTLVVITHDSRVAKMADRQFVIVDGVLSEVAAV